MITKQEIEKLKQLFITMANQGLRKPSAYSTDPEEARIGGYLSYFASGDYPAHKAFAEEIRKLRPDWFACTRNPLDKKNKLLELAKNGHSRPRCNAEDKNEKQLGQALNQFICETTKVYDPDLTRKLRKIRPDWFQNKRKVPNLTHFIFE